MIGKHLLITLRSLKKNILYALLVIVGLAIGITAFLSTIQWSAWHITFDRNFPEKEQIYRLTFEESNEGFYRHTARILHGNALNKIVFSEMHTGIEKLGRLAPFRKAAFLIGEDSYYDLYAYSCDPAFLDIFQPTILQGENENPLGEPFTVILTETIAKKFFGAKDPIGASIELLPSSKIFHRTLISRYQYLLPSKIHWNIQVQHGYIQNWIPLVIRGRLKKISMFFLKAIWMIPMQND